MDINPKTKTQKLFFFFAPERRRSWYVINVGTIVGAIIATLIKTHIRNKPEMFTDKTELAQISKIIAMKAISPEKFSARPITKTANQDNIIKR